MAQSQFSLGYQEALDDVLDVWQREGADAALTYIKDNITHTPKESS